MSPAPDPDLCFIFGEEFLAAAKARGPVWYLKRIERANFRTHVIRLRQTPSVQERRRYCAVLDSTMSGALALFMLDPEGWNEATLNAEMKTLPRSPARAKPLWDDADPDEQPPSSDDDDAAEPPKRLDDPDAKDSSPGRPTSTRLKKVKRRRFQTRRRGGSAEEE